MNNNMQIKLASTPDSTPTPENFALVNSEIPVPQDQQILCETLYLSLDPYMRSQIANRHMSGSVAPGDVMKGETVSKVVKSHHPDFKEGDIVRCFGGWQYYSVHDGDAVFRVDENIDNPSYALSALGMPGLTAYAGLVWQAQPKSTDVVVIPAATGGVGSVAGQLAKTYGCTVIGIAGSQEKCDYAVNVLGYDACINRKTENIGERLDTLCPNGVDIFFDLVGGDTLHTVSERLAVGARVILCGLMADYNKTTRSLGPPPAMWIKSRAIVYGLVVYDFESRRDEFVAACKTFIREGKLVVREDVTLGLSNAPDAFCRLMRGENMGKVIVDLSTKS